MDNRTPKGLNDPVAGGVILVFSGVGLFLCGLGIYYAISAWRQGFLVALLIIISVFLLAVTSYMLAVWLISACVMIVRGLRRSYRS